MIVVSESSTLVEATQFGNDVGVLPRHEIMT